MKTAQVSCNVHKRDVQSRALKAAQQRIISHWNSWPLDVNLHSLRTIQWTRRTESRGRLWTALHGSQPIDYWTRCWPIRQQRDGKSKKICVTLATWFDHSSIWWLREKCHNVVCTGCTDHSRQFLQMMYITSQQKTLSCPSSKLD
jgi:hypothetical protein